MQYIEIGDIVNQLSNLSKLVFPQNQPLGLIYVNDLRNASTILNVVIYRCNILQCYHDIQENKINMELNTISNSWLAANKLSLLRKPNSHFFSHVQKRIIPHCI